MTEHLELWDRRKVAQFLQISPRKFDTKVRFQNRFPEPVPIPGHPRWLAERVREWIKETT